MKKYRVTFTVTTDIESIHRHGELDLERVIEDGLKASQDLAWWHGRKWMVHDRTIEEQEDN